MLRNTQPMAARTCACGWRAVDLNTNNGDTMQLASKAALTLAMVMTFATVAASHAEALHSTRIRIDNSPNPTGYPTETNSWGVFSISLQVNGTWHYSAASAYIQSVSGNIDFCVSYDEDDIDAVRFVIDDQGGDALWIDQWSTYDYDNSANCTGSYTAGQTYGADNQVGWCMSEAADWYVYNDPVVCSLSGVDEYGTGPGFGGAKYRLTWNY